MKKLIPYIAIILSAAYLAAMFIWTGSIAGKAKCKDVSVRIEKSDSLKFVTPGFIFGELKRLGINPKNQPVSEIDTDKIEQLLNKMDYVENVQCYLSGDQRLFVDVTPIRPVLRVFDKQRTYYINREGKQVSANAQFHIDLPIVAGNFTRSFTPTRLLPMTNYIEQNPLLKDIVSMIEVRDSNNIFVIPSIAGHVVNMGSPENYESKFAKLLRIYKEVMPVKGWDAYDTLSVKWDYQIVATKRNGKSRLKVAEYDPETEEEAPDEATVETKAGRSKTQ